MFYFTIIILFASSFTTGLSQIRKINASINPGCTAECKTDYLYLIHVTATSPNDVLHYIWDFSNKPTILIVSTPLNTSLDINWERFLSEDDSEGSVVFSTDPTYMFSIVVDKIIEFNDLNNTGHFNSSNTEEGYKNVIETTDFKWSLTTLHNDTKLVSVIVQGTRVSGDDSAVNGSLKIMLSSFGTEDHAYTLPHLLHTTNATQIDLVLENMPTSHETSRFAVNLISVSSDPKNASFIVKKHKSLDDEHSPGIFTVAEVLTPGAEEGKNGGGYLEWRTVAYTSSDRSMTYSTDIHDDKILEAPFNEANKTVIFSIYGTRMENFSTHHSYVSFGNPGDGFYRKTDYLSWTFLVGIGHPAEEKYSFIVLLVLSIGLGLPLLLICIGTFCVIFRRISRNKDDLFLSH